jgi:hypothetical protein
MNRTDIKTHERYTAYVMADRLYVKTGECTHITDCYCALRTDQPDESNDPALFKFALADAHVVSPPHTVHAFKTVQVPSVDFFYLFNSDNLEVSPVKITKENFVRCVATDGIAGYDGESLCDLSDVTLPPFGPFWNNVANFAKLLKNLAKATFVHAILQSMDIAAEMEEIKENSRTCDDKHTALQNCVNLIYTHRVLIACLSLLTEEYLSENPKYAECKTEVWTNFASIFKLPQVKLPGDNTVHRKLRHH